MRVAIAGGCAFVAIGVGAIVAPRFSSTQYGLPTDDRKALGYIRAVGVRDVVLGLIVLRLAATQDRLALKTVLGISILAAIGDASAVATGRDDAGPKHVAVHAGGAIALTAAWALVRSDR